MLTLKIDNSEIESIFQNGFDGNMEKFLAFIQKSYRQRDSFKLFEEERERFAQTYTKIKDGSMEMLSEEVADQEIDRFLETL